MKCFEKKEYLFVKPGDMVRIGFIYAGCDLNNKIAIYVGEGEKSKSKHKHCHALWVAKEKECYQLIHKSVLPYLQRME